MIDPVALLQQLIRIPSCEPPGGELAVAQAVHAALQGAGIDSTLDEFRPGRANVLGRVPGTGAKPALVFSAHLDTLPPGDGWSRDPFSGDRIDTLAGPRICGRGAADMKSAVAAFAASASQLAARSTPLRGDVLLMFTAGESANCIGARRFVAQGMQPRIGAFLCGEPSSLDLVIVEKAILWARLTAKGEVGHVSGNGGVNGIWRMTEALAALRGLRLDTPAHPLLDGPSLSVGLIRGGTAVNLTPDRCEAEIDVRFAPGMGADAVVAQITAALPPGVTLDVTDFKPAVEEPADSAFVAACAAATRAETGRSPALRGVSYFSDGAILLDGHPAPFCILGPGRLGDSGTADESVSVADLRACTRIYTRIAEEWLA